MSDVTKIREQQLDAALAERLDQITGYAGDAFGNCTGVKIVEWIVPGFVILSRCQPVTVQLREGTIITNHKMFHYLAFALSGNLPGLLIISLDKSTSISGQ